MPEATIPDDTPSRVHVEFAKAALDRFSDWVRFADTKAGAVMVVLGIALSDLLTRAGSLTSVGQARSGWAYATLIAFWIAIGAVVATVTCVVKVLFPKVSPSEESLAFFGDVAKHKTASKYREALLSLPEEKLADHLMSQAFDLVSIAQEKFRWTRWAYVSVFAFLVAWALARLALAQA